MWADHMENGVPESKLLCQPGPEPAPDGLEYVDIFYSHRPDPETATGGNHEGARIML